MEKVIQISEIPIHGVIRLRYDGEKFDHTAVDFPIVRTTVLFSDGEVEVYYFNAYEYKYRNDFSRDHEDWKTLGKSAIGPRCDSDLSYYFDIFDEELLNIIKKDYRDPIVPMNDFINKLVLMCKFKGIWVDVVE